jgi:hypothetical protein
MLSVKVRRVFLARHRIDFRKRFDGLQAEAFQLGADPYDGDCVLFVKRDHTQLRAIVGDGVGLYLYAGASRADACATSLLSLRSLASPRSPPRSCRCCSRAPVSPCTSERGLGVGRRRARLMQNLDETGGEMIFSARGRQAPTALPERSRAR